MESPTVRVPYKMVAPADPAVPTVKVFLSCSDGCHGLKNPMVTWWFWASRILGDDS